MNEINLKNYTQSNFNRGRSGPVIILWDMCWLIFIRLCPQPFYGWKRFVFRLFGAKVGNGVKIRSTAKCNYPWKLTIGDNSWIGEEAWLYALDYIHIGESVVISQRAYICTGTHDTSNPHFKLITEPVNIENFSWVALGATVMPGCRVSEGAIIGANATLTKDAEPWKIYTGNPAKSIKQRTINIENN
jgi:putative colanic acid biosynthesis acetyltransferase WcaF